jgi:hypothetical protein
MIAGVRLPAQNVCKLRIYSSVTSGVDIRSVRAATTAALDLVGSKAGYPLQWGATEEELLEIELEEFAKKIDRGETHLGVVWGIEYGSLEKPFPKLEPMVLADAGVNTYSELFVGQKSGINEIAQLQGKKIALIRHMNLGDKLYFNEIARGQPDFFVIGRPYQKPREALEAVSNGDADCVIINAIRLGQVQKEFGLRIKDGLTFLARSDQHSTPVIFGRRDVVDKLRPGLWNRLTNEFCSIHETPEGKLLIEKWRFNKFTADLQELQSWEKLVHTNLNRYNLKDVQRMREYLNQ